LSPSFAVFVLMSNYFHDVATAMLVACSIAGLLVLPRAGEKVDSATAGFIVSVWRSIRKIFVFSIIWIMAGAALRIGTLTDFEWKNFADRGHVVGLVAKYVIAVIIMIAGALFWGRLSRRVSKLESR